jgi:hypothetical protein
MTPLGAASDGMYGNGTADKTSTIARKRPDNFRFMILFISLSENIEVPH